MHRARSRQLLISLQRCAAKQPHRKGMRAGVRGRHCQQLNPTFSFCRGQSRAESDPLQNTLFSPASESLSMRHPWGGMHWPGGRVRTRPGTPVTCHPSTRIGPGAGSGQRLLPGAHTSIPKPGTCLGRGGAGSGPCSSLQSLATSFPAAGARSPSSRSPPRAAQRVIFYQESIVLASVLQTALRRVCYQSWAALINLVCEAVFRALVNVHYYLPESLL